MVKGDPSLDPSLDPSSRKPSCQAPAGPDDKPDPEVVITDHAIEILMHLSWASSPRFQKSKNSLGNIRARLCKGYTIPNLRLIIDVKYKHWHGNNEQYQYMHPEALSGPGKSGGYLQNTIRWDAKGRPPRECWDRSKPRDINQIGVVQVTIPGGFRG